MLNDFQKDVNERKYKYRLAIDRVLQSGWYILGNEVQHFENEFAQYIGTKCTIGVANGLEALQIALLALGIGKGDQVITTPFSAVATTLAILAVGAQPVFADTTNKGLLDQKHITNAITKHTKAILPVHLYGQACDIETMKKICKTYKLFLIEDAAQACGTTIGKKKAGAFGDINCFSFYPTKNLGAFGDGGAIVTNNKKLADTCFVIRDYGQKEKYLHTQYGLNSRLDELQAALLRVKLTFLDVDNEKRRKTAQLYIKMLSNLPIEILTDAKESNYHLFVIKTKKRDELQKFLLQQNIQTAVHYPRLIPQQPFLQKTFSLANLETAKTLSQEVLSLPCNPFITDEQISYVCKEIRNFFQS